MAQGVEGMNQDNVLPDTVLQALRDGQTIEAIKRLRQSSGLGLKEAKDMIDAYQQGKPMHAMAQASAALLPASVQAALSSGNKIEAIKLLREQTGLGLKEAKDAVEAMSDSEFATAEKQYHPTIEKPSGVNLLGWLAILATLAGALYYFYKG